MLTESERERRAATTDLFYAAAENSLEKIKALLEAHVDPNVRDYEQRTAMHVAARSGGESVIRCLLDHKAEVNLTDSWGLTPLCLSQQAGRYKVEALLKRNGAKLQKVRLQKQAVREKWEINRSEVKLGKELSRTLKSSVNEATWNGVDVIAKFCLPPSEDPAAETAEEREDEMLHEISLLATVRHPDLVMFLGCSITESPIMFITQYMPGGDLERYYSKKSAEANAPWKPGMKTVSRWARDVLRALHFLHHCAEPIIHRDLKPLNILLTKDLLDVKITDFGISKAIPPVVSSPQITPIKTHTMVAKTMTENSTAPSYLMTGGVGSWRYMAPEVARHKTYTEKVDIFAFGLILYFMSSGRQPFYSYEDPVDVLREYSDGKEPRPQEQDCPAPLRPVMVAAWSVLPANRPSAQELAELMVETHSGGAQPCACAVM